MTKKIAKSLLVMGLLATSLSAETTENDVKSIVNNAVSIVNENCDAGLKKIGIKNGEFHNGSLYVFGYDENVNMIVHPVKPHLVGRSYKGKPDVRGKKFRDEIVSKGLNGGGWTTYTYQKPGSKGLHGKKSYSQSAQCNGKKIVLAAGMYDK